MKRSEPFILLVIILINCFELKAQKTNLSNVYAYESKADTLFKSENFKQSIKHFRMAAEIYGDNTIVLDVNI